MNTLQTKKGITSILNNHYNAHNQLFDFDKDSENLKAVLLKIGEIREGQIPQLKELPRKKQKILKKIHNNLTSEEINKILLEEDQKIQSLDRYFKYYFYLRRSLLRKLWEIQNKENASIMCSSSSKTGITNICEQIGIQQPVIDEGGQYLLNKNGIKLQPHDLYLYTKKIYEDNEAGIINETNEKCDIEGNTSLLNKYFLSNLWSDVASQYHSYINKLYQTEKDFENRRKGFIELLDSHKHQLVSIESNDPFAKRKDRSNQILPGIRKVREQSAKVDLNSLNPLIARYKSLISQLYQEIVESKGDPWPLVGDNTKNNQISLNDTLTKINACRISFNHERTFPQWKDAPTVRELWNQASETIEIKYNADWYKKRLRRLSKDKSFNSFTPYEDSYLAPNGTEISDSALSPNGWARKNWAKGGKIENIVEDIFNQSDAKEAEIFNRFNKQSHGLKDFNLLRKLAGWINVRAIAVSVALNSEKRKEFLKEINHITSRIQNNYKEFEAEFMTESIYLSGMYRTQESAISYLCSSESHSQLALLINFEEPIKPGPVEILALNYTQNGKPYSFDINHPEQYTLYNTPILSRISIDPEDNIILPLHFGKNQSRKYFWNKSRSDTNCNLVHDIFSAHSRLKISSMRLIRKYNPIKKVWEYYLSLAIYRLEQSNVADPDKILSIGVDIGDNVSVALSGCTMDTGKYQKINDNQKHLRKHSELEKQTLEEFSNSQKQFNYVRPSVRKRFTDKRRSILAQTSAELTKHALNTDATVVFENQYGNDNKNYGKKPQDIMKKYLKHQTYPRLKAKLLPELQLDGLDKNVLVNVPTSYTSQLCCNCGHISNKCINEQKVFDFLNSDDRFCELKSIVDEQKIDNEFWNDDRTENLRNFRNQNYLNTDIPWCFDIEVMTDTVTRRKSRIDQNDQQITFDKNKKWQKDKYLNTIVSSRPSWYYGTSETYRCLVCGNVTECDTQAALNIARYNVYLEEVRLAYPQQNADYKNILKKIDNISKSSTINTEKLQKFEKEKKEWEEKYAINWRENLLKDEKIQNGFEVWYRNKLLKNGYGSDGLSLWNN